MKQPEQTINGDSPRIGLALSGGASRGIAHIGVLKALGEYRVSIDAIAGTSIGALVGAFQAFGVQVTEMYTQAEAMSWMSIASFSPSRKSLLSNRVIGEIIEKHIGNVNIEDSPVPLAIVATDIRNGEKVILRKGNLARAVMASSCLPGIFAPIEIGGRQLVDGFLLENVPVSPLREMGADVIIGVLLSTLGEYREPTGMFNIMMNAFEIAVDENTRLKLSEADLTITPNLSEIAYEDEERARSLYDEGYKAAIDRMPLILKLIEKKRKRMQGGVWQKIRRFIAPLRQ